MAYTKTNWSNDTVPAINEENLNKIENGIYEAHIKNNEQDNKINEIITNLGGQILWTNSNPLSNFSPQNIILNSNDYDILEIFYKTYRDHDFLCSTKTVKGKGIILNGMTMAGTTDQLSLGTREIAYVNDTTLNAKDCYGTTSDIPSAVSITNARSIPIYIIGYKTGLFN